jgi:Amt family ammonium transporter
MVDFNRKLTPAGATDYFALKGVLLQPSQGSSRIPALVFCVYQLMFAAIT